MYPQSGAGHQAFPRASLISGAQTQSLMCHPTSAFRRPTAPSVPLEPAFMPRGQIASSPDQYRQQQFAPHRGQIAGAMLLQPNQQHLFQSPFVSRCTGSTQEQLVPNDARRVAPPESKVRPVVPLQHPQGLQQQVLYNGVADPESLNRQLRILHAMHYQEKVSENTLENVNRSDLVEMQGHQQGQSEMLSKLRKAHGAAINLIHETQRGGQLIQQVQPIHQKQISPETHMSRRHSATPDMRYWHEEEVHLSQRQRIGSSSSLQPSHASAPRKVVSAMNAQSRMSSATQQDVSHVHRSYPHDARRPSSSSQHTSSSKDYFVGDCGGGSAFRQQAFSPSEQCPQRFVAQKVMQPNVVPYHAQQLWPVQHISHKALPTHKVPVCGKSIPVSTQMFSVESSCGLVRTDALQSKGLIAQTGSTTKVVSQPTGYMKRSNSSESMMPVFSSHQAQEAAVLTSRGGKYREPGALNATSSNAASSRIQQNCAGYSIRELSIKQEQEVMKGIQRAAFPSNEEIDRPETIVTKQKGNLLRHALMESSGEKESMPRIVEVRSLANPNLQCSISGGSYIDQPSSHVPVSSASGRPAKPKSLMIKAHQELQEMPVSDHRVPSRSSMNSESGRKDSWDSGIESPPWPDLNKENVSVGVKRLHYHLHEDRRASSSPNPDQQVLNPENERCERCHSSRPAAFCQESLATKASKMAPPTPSFENTANLQEECDSVETKSQDVQIPRKRSLPNENVHPTLPKRQVQRTSTLDTEVSQSGKFAPKIHENCKKSSIGGRDELPLDLSLKKIAPTPVTREKESSESMSESQENTNCEKVHGYFSAIMMRALKRILSSSDSNFDLKGTETPPKLSNESSDEDSGKYFRPSSVTMTRDNIPKVEDGEVEHPTTNLKEKQTVNKDSCVNLETVICTLMQQSSESFKHVGDVFQYFDGLIKKEMLKELDYQQQGTDAPVDSADEVGKNSDADVPMEVLQNDALCPSQSSEANADVCSSKSDCNQEITAADLDESQDLVIVESSMSPEVPPDSQEPENVALDTTMAHKVEQQKSMQQDSADMMNILISAERIYKRAADAAAEKAARQAAKERAVISSRQDVTKPPDFPCEDNPSLIIDVEEDQSPTSSSPNLNTSSVSRSSTQETQSVPGCNTSQADVQRSTGQPLVKTAFSGRKTDLTGVAGTQVVYGPTGGSGHLTKEQGAVHSRKNSNELSLFNQKPVQSLPRTHRACDPHTSLEGQRHPQTRGARDCGNSYRKIAPMTVWQATGLEANKMKLMRVPSGNSDAKQVQPDSSVPTSRISNGIEIQPSFQKSPIVLLPKIAYVPGQPTQLVSQESLLQAETSKRVFVIQTDTVSQLHNQFHLANSTPAKTSSVDGHCQVVNLATDTCTSGTADSSSTGSSNESDIGPFRLIRIPSKDPPSTKKPFVWAYKIFYKEACFCGVVRSNVPFVPPRMLHEQMYPNCNFDDFCHALQDCNIMQRYMTVLERAALLPDLRNHKISSCKLVSLGEFHKKWDQIKAIIKEKHSSEEK
ncbi:uncharacterized protein [Diadema antillarum]|uniref:uncharacterized protein n=1 Tax=Diadema antillarum TaxID=105358 RepID=UPI003A87A4D0